MSEVHIEYGLGVARKVFAKRGNHSEAHLTEAEVAAIAAVAYKDGLRDSGAQELRYALRGLRDAAKGRVGGAWIQLAEEVLDRTEEAQS